MVTRDHRICEETKTLVYKKNDRMIGPEKFQFLNATIAKT